MLTMLVPAILMLQASIPEGPVLLRRRVDIAAQRRFFMSTQTKMKMDMPGSTTPNPMPDLNMSVTGYVSEKVAPVGKGKAQITMTMSGMKITGLPGGLPAMGGQDTNIPKTISYVVSDLNALTGMRTGNKSVDSMMGMVGGNAMLFPTKPVAYGDSWHQSVDLSKLGMALPVPGVDGGLDFVYTYLGDEMVDGAPCHHIGLYSDMDLGAIVRKAIKSLPDAVKMDMNGTVHFSSDIYLNAADGDFQYVNFTGGGGMEMKVSGQQGFKMQMLMRTEMRRY